MKTLIWMLVICDPYLTHNVAQILARYPTREMCVQEGAAWGFQYMLWLQRSHLPGPFQTDFLGVYPRIVDDDILVTCCLDEGQHRCLPREHSECIEVCIEHSN